MNNDHNDDFLSKPARNLEEFTAKQVYISERLNQQQSPAPSRMS